MKYQLVIQFPDAFVNYDQLIELEDAIIAVYGDQSGHVVDGHDIGSGESNIFIHTDDPRRAFEEARVVLESQGVVQYKAAYRELKGETYTLLWPSGCTDFEVA